MKIVAIDASPGRGVISLSVEEAAASAETAGATVERVRLAALRVHSCTGCGWCKLTGVCKIPDDLPALAESIDDADGVIRQTALLIQVHGVYLPSLDAMIVAQVLGVQPSRIACSTPW